MRLAQTTDAASLAGLINTAFQVESFFIDGDRICEEEVQGLLCRGSFLIMEDARGLAGCVYIEIQSERGYLGLLSVCPSRQQQGTGRMLMAAAEDLARRAGCRFMDLRVVNLRTELPSFYRRLGYEETGVEPFPGDVLTKLPCHFVVMTKALI